MPSLKIGAKVEYTDEGGNVGQGVIHGIRKADTGKGEVVIAYVVDTGNDFRVDTYTHDVRDVAVAEKIDQHISDGLPSNEAIEKAVNADDLPESKIVTEDVRQPEQIDIRPNKIKAL